jgi:PAS domain S-box-containing protein
MTQAPESLVHAEKVTAPGKVDILLVDDEPSNLLALEAILQDLGHNLVTARSGLEALRRLLEKDFAVILLDVQMQELDGFETAKMIRGREKSSRTPIIFLTAYETNRLTTEEAYALGAVDYLIKPLVPVILKAKVSGFVELFQRTAQVKQQADQLRQLEHREFSQKLADENARLLESERRFRTLASLAPVGIIQTDVEGNCQFVNERWCEMAGLAPAQADGQGWFQALHPDDRERFRQEWRHEHRDQAGFGNEYRYQTPDGNITWVRGSAVAVRDDDGDITGYIGVNMDVTEQKRAREELQEEARRKDEFLAMLAHELRNPLAPVRNALQIMKMPGVDQAAFLQAREIMERQIQHLVRLVDDLLDVSRIMRNRIELRKEKLEIGKVFTRAVEMAQSTIDAQGHQLSVSLPPTPIFLEGDPVRLAQVFNNLLMNAAKYTEKAGRIWLSGEQVNGDVLVRVRDTGIGIDPELLPKIFDLFVQSERSLARSQGGLGIGLSLVKRLVEMHGGSIRVGSTGPGQGSEFVICLPALTGPPPQRRNDDAHVDKGSTGTTRHPPRRRRVLVVDDNVDAAESTAVLLRHLGHEVAVVHDGPQTLEAATTFQPEVVLLDIGLPGMSGYDVARMMRKEARQKRPLLAAVTGYGGEEGKRRSHEAGFDFLKMKPVDPAALEKLWRRTRGRPRQQVNPS